LLLLGVGVGLGPEQGIGLFYTSVFFRAAYVRGGRLGLGTAGAFTALVTSLVLVDGLSPEDLRLLPVHASGLTMSAFPLWIATTSLLAWGRELAAGQRLLEAVLDSLHVAVVTTDADGRVEHVNAAAREAGLDGDLLLRGTAGTSPDCRTGSCCATGSSTRFATPAAAGLPRLCSSSTSTASSPSITVRDTTWGTRSS
jgi:hypothetical protein